MDSFFALLSLVFLISRVIIIMKLAVSLLHRGKVSRGTTRIMAAYHGDASLLGKFERRHERAHCAYAPLGAILRYQGKARSDGNWLTCVVHFMKRNV